MSDALAAGLAECIFEKATSKRLTAFNIISIHMNTMIALRRINTPMIPMVNNVSDNAMYAVISIIYNFAKMPTPKVDEAGAIENMSFILSFTFCLTIPLKISTAL